MLSGPVSYAMYNALKSALAQHATLRSLTLASDGGHIFAARGIAELVRRYHLRTYVEETCASACILIFIAADQRELAQGARLGFHSYRLLEAVPNLDPDEEEAKDRATMLARGLDPEFIAKVFTIAPTDMWFPSRDALIAAGVIAAP